MNRTKVETEGNSYLAFIVAYSAVRSRAHNYYHSLIHTRFKLWIWEEVPSNENLGPTTKRTNARRHSQEMVYEKWREQKKTLIIQSLFSLVLLYQRKHQHHVTWLTE